MEWANSTKYNSFNSDKGLSYYENYKQIMEWMEGKSDYLPPPIECNLDPVAECNLNCYFCVSQRYLRTNRAEVGEMRTLPTEYMLRLVDFLAQWGVRGLCISGGGEPTIHKDLDKVILHAKDKMDVAVVTNATLITDKLAEALMECRWIALSIDASDRDTYKVVKGKDYFREATGGARKLADLRAKLGAKVDLCYKFLILPENQHSIYGACKLAKELGVQDFHCFPKETPILLQNGEYKNIENVTNKDKVLNGITVNVERTLQRNYKGNLVKVKAKFLSSFKCTPEHPIYIAELEMRDSQKYIKRKVFKNADELKPYQKNHICDALIVPKNILESKTTYVDFSIFTTSLQRLHKRSDQMFLQPIEVTEELAELFGWYVAEGSRGSNLHSTLAFSLYSGEGENIERICYLVKKLFNRDATVRYENDNSASIRFGSKVLFNAFPQLFGESAHSKKIPDFIMLAKKDIVASFLDAYYKGDGNSVPNKNGDVGITTVSKQLVYQLQLLYMKIGKMTGMCHTVETREASSRLYWNVGRRTRQYVEDDDNYYFPIVDISRESFEGTVYNLTTTNGIYALPFIVHNCRPVDFERKDIIGNKKLVLDKGIVEKQFAKCHELESKDFRVYTVTHKFDPEFHIKHDFKQCLATPLVIPILQDGNVYICVDKKMESKFRLGSCYPEPEQILEWWGSEGHRQMIKSVNIEECSRCTWSQYNRQISECVMKDGMCLSFP